MVCINHVYRKGNRAMDWLANFALSLSVGSHFLDKPFSRVLGLLLKDISMFTYFEL